MKCLFFFALPFLLVGSARAQECGSGCQELRPVAGALPRAEFGSSVAVRGAVAAVGSPGRDVVTVFEWNRREWEAREDVACPACDATQDYFGLSIALGESRMAVGAPRAGPGGRLFRFRRSGESFSRALPALPAGEAGESFGWSVALEDDSLVVGAPRADDSRGRVYVYDWGGEPLGILEEGAADDQFGIAVALGRRVSGGSRLLAVGAPFAEKTGVVYVYELRDGEAPPEVPLEILRPSDGVDVDAFGFTVAVDGDTVLVGSPQHDQRGSNSGAVYFYQREATSWRELEVTPSVNQTRADDQFGIAVALRGRTALVGARRHDGAARDGGAVFFFERSSASWRPTARWLGEGQPGAELGIAVALDGVSTLAGAYLADEGAGTAYALGLEADLGVSLERLGEPTAELLPGDRIVYKVTIENAGPDDAACGRVRFQPATVLEDAEWTKRCGTDSGTCPTPEPVEGQLVDTFDVVSGERLTCRVAAKLTEELGDEGTEDMSRVFLDLPSGVFDRTSNEREAPVPVERDASLRILIAADDGSGRERSWRFTVLNDGPRHVAGASLTGLIVPTAALLSGASVTCEAAGKSSCGCPEPASCLSSPDVFSDTVDLASGDEVVYRLRAETEVSDEGGQLTLAASVEPPGGIVNTTSTPELCGTLSLESSQATCARATFEIESFGCPFGDEVCDGEFRVDPTESPELRYLPAAAGSSGELAVVWLSRPLSLDSAAAGLGSVTPSVRGRRFTPEGSQDFLVTTETGFPAEPAIGLDGAGGFVVVWGSLDLTASYGLNLRGRRFRDGAALGGEFLISPGAQEHQLQPDVAFRPGGGFVVVWANRRTPEPPGVVQPDVVGQLFDAEGEPEGSRFVVNTYTKGAQRYPALAVDGEGGFTVVWTSGDFYSEGPDGSGTGIRGRRFASDGTPSSDEIGVNSSTAGSQVQPDVGVDESGDFIVVWADLSLPKVHKLGRSIRGRRFASDGAAQGEEFQVDLATDGRRRRPRIAVAPDGSVLVVWEHVRPVGLGSVSSIRGRRFTSDGRSLAGELEIASSATASLADPAVARAADDFFVVWSSDATRDDVALPTSIRGRRLSARWNVP